MTANKFFILIILFSCIACQNRTTRMSMANNDIARKQLAEIDRKYSSVKPQKLSARQIVRFDEKYPVSVDVLDSLLYIVMVRSDTALYICNTQTGVIEATVGHVGNGPEDILSPEYIGNNYEFREKGNKLLCYDLNAKKFFYLSGGAMFFHSSFAIDNMYPARSLNISGNYWIGQVIRGDNEKMFSIYNDLTKRTISVDRSPIISDLEKVDQNYLYSINLGVNQAKQRIVVGMYFFDLIHIYDWEGNIVRMLSLSPDYDPGKSAGKMFSGGDYVGYPQMYSNRGYCYLRRDLVSGVTRSAVASQIIRINWSGDICGIYEIDERLTGRFCVDDSNQHLYCISQIVDNDSNNEYYDIVSYEL